MVSPAWTFLLLETPALFSSRLSSHVLLAGYYPVLTDACILLCKWCKNTYVWKSEGSRIIFFKKTAFEPSVWIQNHINIDFTKFGATAFIISFLRLRRDAHFIQRPTADNLVEPTERVLLPLCLHYSNSPFAVQYYRPMSWILDPIPWIVDSGCWIPFFFSLTWTLDSIP